MRLLLKGHDAKSIARHLRLSVHTINERLRDARRKLGVSSSREAARLLYEDEQGTPEYLSDMPFGVTDTPADGFLAEQAVHRRGRSHRLAWFSGGMLVMSLLVAAFALSSVVHGDAATGVRPADLPVTTGEQAASASQRAAREWLALLDRGRWEESWRTAAGLFKSRITAAQWALTVQAVRQPLGAPSSRVFLNVTRSSSLPGVPVGDYEVILFRTRFAGKDDAVETVTLARGRTGWNVAGYFIH